MKLPNNYGSISKLSGNRRRPFMVRKSLDGTQLVIGYFETPAFVKRTSGSRAKFPKI